MQIGRAVTENRGAKRVVRFRLAGLQHIPCLTAFYFPLAFPETLNIVSYSAEIGKIK